MTYQQIIKDLTAKKYHPVYFLYGKEPYFIDAVANYIEKKVLTESEKAFNQTILYGKEIDHKQVTDVAQRYPMMASHQVVIIKEAQEMRTLKQLQYYIEKPLETTILVLCHKHKKFDSRTKFGKALKANTVLFESKQLYDNQLPDWIIRYLKEKGFGIERAACVLLAEYLGTDLAKVANELDKLSINLPAKSTITSQQIQDNIGISKDYNVFELQKALGQRQIAKANRIAQYFATNPRKNPLVLMISSLYNYFSKIYSLHFLKSASEQDILKSLKLRSAFFLKEYRQTARYYNRTQTEQVLALLKEYDLKSKGVDFPNVYLYEGELMKELVWKIVHV